MEPHEESLPLELLLSLCCPLNEFTEILKVVRISPQIFFVSNFGAGLGQLGFLGGGQLGRLKQVQNRG